MTYGGRACKVIVMKNKQLPTPIHLEDDLILPVVANIDEARLWSKDFKSILTAGPSKTEVRWGHTNHRVWEFGDTTTGRHAPTLKAVTEAIKWGEDQEDLLVHCHAGMSRSTSIAWGISIARGADPLDSFLALRNAQPKENSWLKDRVRRREFIPNRLIVQHLDTIFGTNGGLFAIRMEHMTPWAWAE